MKGEFLEAYEDLFNDAYQRLFRALKIKLSAMKHCQIELEKEVNQKLQFSMANMFKKKIAGQEQKPIDYRLKVTYLKDIDDSDYEIDSNIHKSDKEESFEESSSSSYLSSVNLTDNESSDSQD